MSAPQRPKGHRWDGEEEAHRAGAELQHAQALRLTSGRRGCAAARPCEFGSVRSRHGRLVDSALGVRSSRRGRHFRIGRGGATFAFRHSSGGTIQQTICGSKVKAVPMCFVYALLVWCSASSFLELRRRWRFTATKLRRDGHQRHNGYTMQPLALLRSAACTKGWALFASAQEVLMMLATPLAAAGAARPPPPVLALAPTLSTLSLSAAVAVVPAHSHACAVPLHPAACAALSFPAQLGSGHGQSALSALVPALSAPTVAAAQHAAHSLRMSTLCCLQPVDAARRHVAAAHRLSHFLCERTTLCRLGARVQRASSPHCFHRSSPGCAAVTGRDRGHGARRRALHAGAIRSVVGG